MGMANSGMFAESHRVELIEGHIREEMPQGDEHYSIYAALEFAFQAMGGVFAGIKSSPTLLLGGGDVYDPEYLIVTADAPKRGRPEVRHVILAVEVSWSSLDKDMGPKKRGYARAGVPHYWVFDAVHGRLHAFSEPQNETYATEKVLSAGDQIEVPGVGQTLQLSKIFA